MTALIYKQISYKLESTFPVIIVEALASFSFPSLSMLISKTFMPKRTRETNGFIYFYQLFLDTCLPGGNMHKRDSGPMRGAIATQSHNP